MTGKGHVQIGIASSIAAFYASFEYLTNNDIFLSGILSLFLILGSKAPDWLEIQKSDGSTVIPHRTITHWFPIWIAILLLGFAFKDSQGFHSNFIDSLPHSQYIADAISLTLIGLSLGSLLHIITDLPNPMGVPFLTPWHRVSLNLWKSGRFEFFFVGIAYTFSIGWVLFDLNLISLNF